ncbi:MAG: radical SAM protein [Elusimicrobia bacterium]|nr:radical SAM protein [Elusimicrobiota bacterium]
MFDPYKRRIDYLRISVTDRCNLACDYCAPEGAAAKVEHAAILSFEEIADFTARGAELGIRKVRLTGGEPLLRRDLPMLVSMLSAIPGISDLAMTTNGILLPGSAAALKAAGLKRINVSLDAVDPARFRKLTHGGDVHAVFRGLEAALAAGLSPVKVNCVVQEGPDEPDAAAVRAWCQSRGLEPRFIKRMDLKEGRFSVVQGGSGGDCGRCSRLRLTSTGLLKPCLFSDLAFDIRALGHREALLLAVARKPERGAPGATHSFHQIGG